MRHGCMRLGGGSGEGQCTSALPSSDIASPSPGRLHLFDVFRIHRFGPCAPSRGARADVALLVALLITFLVAFAALGFAFASALG